jgi:hypothetical protein
MFTANQHVSSRIKPHIHIHVDIVTRPVRQSPGAGGPIYSSNIAGSTASTPQQLRKMADIHAHPMHRTILTSIIERDSASTSDIEMKDGRARINGSRTTEPPNTPDGETVDADQPAGVQQMEAITIVWTKKWLVIAYALSGIS